MAEPVIAQTKPYVLDVKAGEKYFWCACGQSGNQPFCDGSHKETEFRPQMYEAGEDGKVAFCGCKRSGGTPFCDGTHKDL